MTKMHFPAIGHLRIWSGLADIRDDSPSCSKYRSSAGFPTDNVSRTMSEGPLGFRLTVAENVNLSQFEVLLRASGLVGWLFQSPEEKTKGILQILLQSGVFLKITLDNRGTDINGIEINHWLTSYVKKKQPNACAISGNLIVLACSTTELLTVRLGNNADAKNKKVIQIHRRRSKKADEFDCQLVFNRNSTMILFSFAPKVSVIKRWLPKRPTLISWTLEVYACDSTNEIPLRRLHKLTGQPGELILQMSFLWENPTVFLILTEKSSPESSSIAVHRYAVEQHSLRLNSAVKTDCFEGRIISCDIHCMAGKVALGLDDHSIILFDDVTKNFFRGPCDVSPHFLKWNSHQTILAVGSAEASFQLFDCSLQLLSSALINDTCSYVDTLRLRNCMNSSTPLVKFDWVDFSTVGEETNPAYFSSALLLYFERGPIGMLCFGSDKRSTTSVGSVLNFWLNQKKFAEAVQFLKTTEQKTSVSEIIQSSRRIVNDVIRSENSSKISGDVLETLMKWLSGSHPSRNAEEIQALQTCYSVLLRRSFGWFLRCRMFDHAIRTARSCQDAIFFKMLRNATEVQEDAASLAWITLEANQFLENNGLDDLITPTNPVDLGKKSPELTDENNVLSWTDFGEI